MHSTCTLHPCDIDICTDCVTVLANGSEGDETLEVAAQRLTDLWPGDSPVTTPAVTLGRTDATDDTPHFSWQPCDGCGSTLGGDRHPATGWYDPEGHR